MLLSFVQTMLCCDFDFFEWCFFKFSDECFLELPDECFCEPLDESSWELPDVCFPVECFCEPSGDLLEDPEKKSQRRSEAEPDEASKADSNETFGDSCGSSAVVPVNCTVTVCDESLIGFRRTLERLRMNDAFDFPNRTELAKRPSKSSISASRIAVS